jgi:glycosyltransferase involved in cell wall biosynthesis
MKTSVLVIAHNEEKYISECILSILNQNQKPNEVVVIVHNSTDKTLEIAQKYPIKVISFNGEIGPVYARLEGIKNVAGDIVLCIDGDSVAKNNWVEIMTETLKKNNNVLVGSLVKINGTIFATLGNVWNKYFCVSKNKRATRWLWGASFAFWGKDKDFVLKSLEKSIDISKSLGFTKFRIAEDYILALFMIKIGNIEVTNKTFVVSYSKETSIIKEISRNGQNMKNGRSIKCFVENNL